MLSTIPSGERRSTRQNTVSLFQRAHVASNNVSMGCVVLTAESVKTTHVCAVGFSCTFAQMNPKSLVGS